MSTPAKNDSVTGYDAWFHPYEVHECNPEEFDWKFWLEEHIKDKDWKDPLKITIDDTHTAKAKAMFEKLTQKKDGGGTLECPPEIAYDLSLLSLYDLVLLLDDSTSMELNERLPTIAKDETIAETDLSTKTKKRKDTLAMVLGEVCEIYECTRTEGVISMRFFNTPKGKKDVTRVKADTYMQDKRCQGVTKIGTELKRKIIDPFVFNANAEQKRPLLVIVITDGKVEGEKVGLLEHVIINCVDACKEMDKKGENAVSFQFAQIGRDKDAATFLRRLGMDKTIKNHIDCVLNASLDYISDEDLKWEILAQLLLGAVTTQWNRHNAPLLWFDQPTEGAKNCRRSEPIVNNENLDTYGATDDYDDED